MARKKKARKKTAPYEAKEEWHEKKGRSVLVRSDGKKFYQRVCSSCGAPFHFPAQRGAPPKRCPECQKKKKV